MPMPAGRSSSGTRMTSTWASRSWLIDSVIQTLGAAERARDRVVDPSAALADRLARRREVPDSEWSRDERAFVDREHYGGWRRDTEKAVEAAERVLADRCCFSLYFDRSPRFLVELIGWWISWDGGRMWQGSWLRRFFSS